MVTVRKSKKTTQRVKREPMAHKPIPTDRREHRRWQKQVRADQQAARRCGAGDLMLILAEKCNAFVGYMDEKDRDPNHGPMLIVYSPLLNGRANVIGAAEILKHAAMTTEKIDSPVGQLQLRVPTTTPKQVKSDAKPTF